MVLAIPPWASGKDALKKHVVPTTLGSRMPSSVVADPNLTVSGVRLLWAAITSGRPPGIVPTVFDSSNAAYRQWRIWASLGEVEPDGCGGLRRTAEFRQLDSTEKGHLNYALAGALTKAYAGAKLDSPWLAHLSLASKAKYDIAFRSSVRHRPDYFGVTYNGDFIIGEAKGRIHINAGLRSQLNSKQQTGAVKSVTTPGSAKAKPVARYGVAVATGGKALRLYVTDPPDEVRRAPDPNDWIRAYYAFILELAERVNDEVEGLDPFAPPVRENWRRVRLMVPERARRWANGEGSPLEEWNDDREGLIEALQREATVGDVNPDLTYFV